MIDKGIPRHDYDVCDADGNVVGKVTSGTMSDSNNFKLGTEIFIKVRKKMLKAEIVRFPFYKG